MKIKQLIIQNFRGIKSLNWIISKDISCLIGPGDSCKSTILDAIEKLLFYGRNFSICDADFFEFNNNDPIVIEAVLSEIPSDLMTEDKYGLDKKGWKDGSLSDDITDGYESVLQVQLTINKDLEPHWVVLSNRNPDGTILSYFDRQRISSISVGNYFETQFNWARGSSLYKFTDQCDDALSAILDVSRLARESVDDSKLSSLTTTASQVEKTAKKFGVNITNKYNPKIDPKIFVGSTLPIILCDGAVPVRMSGLGSKRLLMLSMQYQENSGESVVLADEVEYGLEPHRLRLLLDNFKKGVCINSDDEPEKVCKQQVFITTHSPIAVSELGVGEICVVKNNSGTLTINPIPNDIMGIAKTHAESLLGKKIIVCEGKTELGLIRSFGEYWESEGSLPFGQLGVALTDGGGSNKFIQAAIGLSKLEYCVSVVKDTDVDAVLKDDIDEMKKHPITVIEWEPGKCLESVLFSTLPWDGVCEMVELGSDIKTWEVVKANIASQLSASVNDFSSENPNDWLKKYKEIDLRKAFSTASSNNKNGWYKSVSGGIALAEITIKYLNQITKSDFYLKINNLKSWIYGDETKSK